MLRNCEEEKDVEGEERIRERTSARLYAGDINQRDQIQHLNSRYCTLQSGVQI
jgi:hypothetical protein